MTMRKNIPLDLHPAGEWIASQKSKVRWKIATDNSFRLTQSLTLHLVVEVLRDINRNWSFMLNKEVHEKFLRFNCRRCFCV